MKKQGISSKQVLIVDDKPNVALTLSASLEKLGEEYVFDMAHNAQAALAKIEQTDYTLLITDYNMPGMSGLELIQQARQRAPEIQIIVMTAYGTEGLRQTVGQIAAADYIAKPFTVGEIRVLVERATGRAKRAKTKEALARSQANRRELGEELQQKLKLLRANTRADCVMLLSSDGYPVSVVGQIVGIDISSVSALVVANFFMAATELAKLLGNSSSMFRSSYFEGDDYNIYSYDINGEFLLVMIVGSKSKPGSVWYYTKQTAAELAPLILPHATEPDLAESKEMSEDLNFALDDLFESGQPQVEKPVPQKVVREPLVDSRLAPENKVKKPVPQKVVRERVETTPLSFEQAVAAGLVPAQLVQRELGSKKAVSKPK